MAQGMTLHEAYLAAGAALASDGIPLHFGDLTQEYEAALHHAVVLDRSHEGRLYVVGRDRFELLNRMSTNNLMGMTAGQGVPTLFTNANARVIDRAVAYYENDERLLVITGPGRGNAVFDYLRRNIFFNDQVSVQQAEQTSQFAVHGVQADAVMAALLPGSSDIPVFGALHGTLNGVSVFAVRMEPLIGAHWAVICAASDAAVVWRALVDAGAAPAGGLTYNTLRIRAGRPGTGRELTTDYIPLELGLWDEVSFNKGCYTGQEIIARMESRNKLARTLVRLELEVMVNAPADLFHEGKQAGTLTSSVTAPDGVIYAMGIVKVAHAEPGTLLVTAQGAVVRVVELLGVQPLTR
ncbi:MAG: glycine cleavage T C-terminal barrel domain-containing protein [Anaerolineae bacterium]